MAKECATVLNCRKGEFQCLFPPNQRNQRKQEAQQTQPTQIPLPSSQEGNNIIIPDQQHDLLAE